MPITMSATSTRGDVVNIEPSIQAAFVDFGVGRNGFLHISDVESQYFRQGGYDPDKAIGFDGRQRHDELRRDEPRRDEPRRDDRRAQKTTCRMTMKARSPKTAITPTRKTMISMKTARVARGSSAVVRASVAGRESSRQFKIFCAAATSCWCKSSKKASAPRGRRFPPTSAFPAATWC